MSYSPDEALAHFILDMGLGQKQYVMHRVSLRKKKHGYLIPTYHEVLAAKKPRKLPAAVEESVEETETAEQQQQKKQKTRE